MKQRTRRSWSAPRGRSAASFQTAWLGLWLACVACGEAQAPASLCEGVEADTQSLFNANREPSTLTLSCLQRSAIGAVLPQVDGEALCSGVLVAPSWVLTSKHCHVADAFMFATGADAQVSFHSAEVVDHPELDLMLVRIDGEPPSPLPLIDEALDPSWIGSEAELAGYGLTEDGEAGQLRFVAEPIAQLDDGDIRVDGDGSSGACLGDSGGPLLVRGRDGTPRVAGVLAQGSDSCVGIDVYTRLDLASVRAWISAHTHN